MFLYTHPIYLTSVQKSNFGICHTKLDALLLDTANTVEAATRSMQGAEPHMKYPELHETQIVYRVYGFLYVIN